MIDTRSTPYVMQYRASVEDEATPVLDQTILEAAGRELAKRRFVRRAGGAVLLIAVAVLSSGIAWRAQQSTPVPAAVTGYGTIEGLTRPYLLQVETVRYSGPGLTEGAQ